MNSTTRLRKFAVCSALVAGMNFSSAFVQAQPVPEPIQRQMGAQNQSERAEEIFRHLSRFVIADSTSPTLRRAAGQIVATAQSLIEATNPVLQSGSDTRNMTSRDFDRFIFDAFFTNLRQASQRADVTLEIDRLYQRAFARTSLIPSPVATPTPSVLAPVRAPSASEVFISGLANRGITSDPTIAQEILNLVVSALRKNMPNEIPQIAPDIRSDEIERRLRVWAQATERSDFNPTSPNILALQREVLSAVRYIRSRYDSRPEGVYRLGNTPSPPPLFVYSFDYSGSHYEVITTGEPITTISQLRTRLSEANSTVSVRQNGQRIESSAFLSLTQNPGVLSAMRANSNADQNMGWNRSQLN